MSIQARDHDPAHLDGVLLYALERLPASDRAVVDAQLAACAQCREELHALRPIVTSMVDVLRPPPSLWDRLVQRIGAETGAGPRPAAAAPPIEPEWKDVAPGISCKLLATDTDNDRVSMLVRLAPRTEYPPHRHAGVEELHLLHGELMIEDRKLYPGDYNCAEPGTVDRRVWSETGCTCVLITSAGDVIL